MKRVLLTLLAVAVLLFVWYDGVEHGWRMVVDPQGGALFFRNAVHHLACTPLYEHPK